LARNGAAVVDEPRRTSTRVIWTCRSTPLFSFGHGLSYTTFQYSALKLASDAVDVGGEARLNEAAGPIALIQKSRQKSQPLTDRYAVTSVAKALLLRRSCALLRLRSRLFLVWLLMEVRLRPSGFGETAFAY
jgi:hypothetical protein